LTVPLFLTFVSVTCLTLLFFFFFPLFPLPRLFHFLLRCFFPPFTSQIQGCIFSVSLPDLVRLPRSFAVRSCFFVPFCYSIVSSGFTRAPSTCSVPLSIGGVCVRACSCECLFFHSCWSFLSFFCFPFPLFLIPFSSLKRFQAVVSLLFHFLSGSLGIRFFLVLLRVCVFFL